MANSVKRPPPPFGTEGPVSVFGVGNGTNNFGDAACAAVHPTAVKPVSSGTGKRRIVKNAPWMDTAMSCGLYRIYHAASSYSSHAPSSRAAGAVGESCDLAPPFFPFPPLLSGCVRVPPCARLSPALVAAYTLPLCLIHCTPVGSRLPPGFKTLPCPRTVGQPVCVLPDRRMQFAPLSLPLLLAPPCGRPSWLRSV